MYTVRRCVWRARPSRHPDIDPEIPRRSDDILRNRRFEGGTERFEVESAADREHGIAEHLGFESLRPTSPEQTILLDRSRL
ncbi:MAG: hypothetical protein R3B91_11855 [Planctomycetaceae bacterium]